MTRDRAEKESGFILNLEMATTTATAGPSTAASEKEIAQRVAVFQRLHPKAYFERFIAEGFRPDGRESLDWRDLSVNVGEYLGVAWEEKRVYLGRKVLYPRQMALR